MEAPVRKVASGIIAAAAEFRGTSSPRTFDFLEETKPNPEEIGARNRAPRGFPDVMLRSTHARKDSPIWLISISRVPSRDKKP
jgi:hypothetical protein